MTIFQVIKSLDSLKRESRRIPQPGEYTLEISPVNDSRALEISFMFLDPGHSGRGTAAKGLGTIRVHPDDGILFARLVGRKSNKNPGTIPWADWLEEDFFFMAKGRSSSPEIEKILNSLVL